MALKAVARARYLRLPLAVSRQPAPQPRTLGPPASTSSISSYRRPISRPEPDPQPVTETEEESDVPPSVPPTRFGRGKSGISSLLASRPPRSVMSEDITTRRPRAPASIASTRPKLSTRAPSPTASVLSARSQTMSEVVAPSLAASSSGGAFRRTRLLQELESRGFKSRPFH